MFSDRFGLTDAVLAWQKTMTRRLAKLPDGVEPDDVTDVVMVIDDKGKVYFTITAKDAAFDIYPYYQIGEVVAIAQRYSVLNEKRLLMDDSSFSLSRSKGWNYKMFIKTDLMPHRIRITNIKVERLQDITEPDCIKEGLLAGEQEPRMYGFRLPKGTVLSFLTPRDAFAALIDRISGKGTWNRNPWVFAYEFELINKED